ncbi:hypothetical protein [Agaribacter marinus]|uniref:Uncharacterized protein n=1 Tax=Agaribacter marinus TaxID=1431249 RepID=A0AA37WIL4_9ALTE|nr:hypothetical protein [Agaribacter marinus]GLR71102.1 hypothetical protein GCM10007852_20100 [Agaribacter marinus]
MDALLVIVISLFVIVIALLAFCLTESKGAHTKYARRHNSVTPIDQTASKTEKQAIDIDQNSREVA